MSMKRDRILKKNPTSSARKTRVEQMNVESIDDNDGEGKSVTTHVFLKNILIVIKLTPYSKDPTSRVRKTAVQRTNVEENIDDSGDGHNPSNVCTSSLY
jgi:hypothetical protein